jgi:CBS domain-containing protein
MKISEILEEKGRNIFTIRAEATLSEAATLMKKRDVGALLVQGEETFGGIITERDIVCVLGENVREFKSLTVSELMVSSENLIVAEPDDQCEHVMAVMIHKNIRHMPVVENERIVGIVSIRDLVRATVMKVRAQAHFLSDYIR